tara:strand:+ start:972 stop:2666 length:1695 start_codon:yes stop_codon:yes gene_type:complete
MFLKKNSYIIILLFLTTIIFFPGSIAGDFEKVYFLAKIPLDYDLSIGQFNILSAKQLNEYIGDPEFLRIEPFISRNYIFIFLLSYLIKFINFLNIFFSLNENELKFTTELIISFFPSFLFLSSSLLIYKSYEKKVESNILLFGIFLFFFSSYLLNFLSSHFFAEATIIFLLSLRIYLKQKQVGLVYLAIIDLLLIKIRVTCFVIVAYFIIEEIIKNKTKFKSYIHYFLIIIILSILYNYFTFQTDNNEIIGRITKSACAFGENFQKIIFQYIYKIFLSYFSLTVGVIFIFPLFILFIFQLLKNLSDKILILKFLTLGAIISLFALEEYWYLPAGISGHRGIAPFLIIIFPDIIDCLKDLMKKNAKVTLFSGFFLYLVFFPSLEYRNTVGFFSSCGTINKPCISFYTMFDQELTYLTKAESSADEEISKHKCRHPNLFSNSNIKMHAGIYGWRVILNKLLDNEKIRIYYKKTDGLKKKFNYKTYNENYKKGYFEQNTIHFIPHTMISRIPYTLNLRFNLISDKKIFNNLNFNSSLTAIINSLSLLIKLFYMIFPIYFFLRKFKII